MSGQALRCAYCDKPLEVSAFGVLAWRAGKDFVCDEFCADGIEPAHIAPDVRFLALARLPAMPN
ncbi:MAG: hypothetical protein WBQ24_12650 [Xanthobacteraceae bacterium]